MSIIKKLIAGFTGMCVGATITQIVSKNTQPTSRLEKITLAIGSFVISSMIADKASEYVDNEIDNTLKEIREISFNIQTESEEEYEVH